MSKIMSKVVLNMPWQAWLSKIVTKWSDKIVLIKEACYIEKCAIEIWQLHINLEFMESIYKIVIVLRDSDVIGSNN